MAGKFVLSTRKNGDFQFVLKAGNGQVILTSQGYNDKAGALNGIESVKKNAKDASFERLTAKDGSPYFTQKAGNGQVIGQSEMYKSATSRENGIASVIKHAPDAGLRDDTV
ncbi:MAG: YegP family protein [Pseudoxanthomonas sp.]